ncbi:MAG: elongation factor 1-alpha C-terminal domain-related protein, partial [bacterium]
MSVVLRLKDEIDISRGDVICKVDDPTRVDRRVEADVVWMSETPLDPGKSYLIKHGTAYVRVNVEKIEWKRDLQQLAQVGGVDALGLTDLGRVRVTTHRPLCYDPSRR